jgi:hypothetical protein
MTTVNDYQKFNQSSLKISLIARGPQDIGWQTAETSRSAVLI